MSIIVGLVMLSLVGWILVDPGQGQATGRSWEEAEREIYTQRYETDIYGVVIGKRR